MFWRVSSRIDIQWPIKLPLFGTREARGNAHHIERGREPKCGETPRPVTANSRAALVPVMVVARCIGRD